MFHSNHKHTHFHPDNIRSSSSIGSSEYRMGWNQRRMNTNQDQLNVNTHFSVILHHRSISPFGENQFFLKAKKKERKKWFILRLLKSTNSFESNREHIYIVYLAQWDLWATSVHQCSKTMFTFFSISFFVFYGLRSFWEHNDLGFGSQANQDQLRINPFLRSMKFIFFYCLIKNINAFQYYLVLLQPIFSVFFGGALPPTSTSMNFA